MEFGLTEEQRLIQSQIRELCEEFGDEYWREKDRSHEYPAEFFERFADDGWCGITVPEAYGGQGYGVLEAAIVQHPLADSWAKLQMDELMVRKAAWGMPRSMLWSATGGRR